MPNPKEQRLTPAPQFGMPATELPGAESSETVGLKPTLSSDAQTDLKNALSETVDAQKAWVERNQSALLGRSSNKRIAGPPAQPDVDVFGSAEGTEKDLRQVLVSGFSLRALQRIVLRISQANA